MIAATRRQALKGALAVSSVAGLPGVAAARSGGTLLVHDPELIAGQRLAQVQGGEVLPIKGDRIRFARAVFEQRPSLVIGVSRPADALLIEDVGREAGYVPVSAEALREMLRDDLADRGLVLGWALAPKA